MHYWLTFNLNILESISYVFKLWLYFPFAFTIYKTPFFFMLDGSQTMTEVFCLLINKRNLNASIKINKSPIITNSSRRQISREISKIIKFCLCNKLAICINQPEFAI